MIIKTTINNLDGSERIEEREETQAEILERENAQKELEKQNRSAVIKARLAELSQDFVQVELGGVLIDLEERKVEFRTLHNELRSLLGKPLREYRQIEILDN